MIDFHGDPPVVSVPDRVPAGEEFQVLVRTYGGGCIQQGETVVRLETREAVIVPYDIVMVRLPPDAACTLELRSYEHVAAVRFDSAGPASVIVRGSRRPGGDLLTLRYPVTVF